MVTLNAIYTRTGDGGSTRLATGAPVSKASLRVDAYGGVDETNAFIGVARQHTAADPQLDALLERIQNDLFDLGADLATPEQHEKPAWEPLRIIESQVDRLEAEIDRLNGELSALTSFVLPAGSPASAALHVARTVCRRAERSVVLLSQTEGEIVSQPALKYLNRLSDLLFVAARWANDKGAADVLWKPGATR
ncbi:MULTISPECIES: cob(I)yrinic acid a,c-diamide adenosyltransferase [unclassified Caulobacter]|uniref:cob(I)yrinic acid a,c-diamide adenosyltransferase n=1 Tax=unclassified Caulobacter TaxID=2648921 RepID=UPI000D395537|nr:MULTISPECIES: cob(I)yrinic acid a,c-diamide adenosyltransferase [unclassified Caulobacter]PTS81756.1 cob(I)yrinic acid a,c-diamide adenosyltransferase [Caulobacter sp. HMWF009]PTT07186.1 cob(I)yrinic acid a,c-diamide adenosyltransferase [Caulobacter sp. HMWF025]